ISGGHVRGRVPARPQQAPPQRHRGRGHPGHHRGQERGALGLEAFAQADPPRAHQTEGAALPRDRPRRLRAGARRLRAVLTTAVAKRGSRVAPKWRIASILGERVKTASTSALLVLLLWPGLAAAQSSAPPSPAPAPPAAEPSPAAGAPLTLDQALALARANP